MLAWLFNLLWPPLEDDEPVGPMHDTTIEVR